jgi:hypothetical protein
MFFNVHFIVRIVSQKAYVRYTGSNPVRVALVFICKIALMAERKCVMQRSESGSLWKMLALTGQIPTVQIANIVMPSAEERAKIDVSHRALDAVARRLAESQR